MHISNTATGDEGQRLQSKAMGHLEQFQETRNINDLDQTVNFLKEAIFHAPEGSQELAGIHDTLGDALIQEFRLMGDVGKLDQAFSCWNKAVALAPGRYHDPVERLVELGGSAYRRYEQHYELADLDTAIDYENLAVTVTVEGDTELPGRLNSLGVFLHTRSQRLGNRAELDKSIEYKQRAMILTPEGHPDRPEWLDSLGVSLHTRFLQLGDIADLERSIEYAHQVMLLSSEGHSDRPRWLHGLGVSLHSRFQRLGDLSDLDNSIDYLHQAMMLTLEGHPDRARWPGSLGESLYTRYQELGGLSDLDKSIEYLHQAILLTSEGHPDRPRWLDSLGASLYTRFQQLGDLADLERLIGYLRSAMLLTPEGDSDRPRRLHSLGVSLHSRFRRLGDLADLDKSIEYAHQAMALTPERHSDRPSRFNSLGTFLHTRFQRLGDLADLDKDIEYSTQAMLLTPEGHSSRPWRFHGLSTSLHTRFKRLGDLADLDKSIEHVHQAILLTPEGHLERPRWLDGLGVCLHTRFQKLGDLADLNKSIEYAHQAMLLTPEGHPERPGRLGNLSTSLYARFEQVGDLADLNRDIDYSAQAMLLTPEGHSDRPRRLNNLGISLYARFEHLDALASSPVALEHRVREILPHPWLNDLSDSIRHFQSAAESTAGPPKNRFDAALQWARCSPSDDTSNIVAAYNQVMKILPQLVWLGTPVESRYHLILDVAGSVSTEAASEAIAMQDYSLALEWLEEGRSIVWKQMLQLRTPIDDLLAVDSTLAEELKQVARNLDNSSSPRPMGQNNSLSDVSLEQAAQHHHQLATQWEKLVNKARGLPGFEAFLRAQKASELMRSARSGPVVVINIDETRCDALVIQPGVTGISHIPLQFTLEQATDSRIQMLHFVRGRGLDVRGIRVRRPDPKDQFRGALGVLWKDVVKPILHSLGYLQPSSTGNLPHITWCTTGPLSFLPLHAAGDYDSQVMIFNYVVSSYTPTLSALLSPDQSNATFSGILAVGQESTPGMNPLPGTVAELTQIQKVSQGHTVTMLNGHLATPTAVMAGMEAHSWVHLACHASQNPTSPLESAFYLHGGKLDLATITQKQLKNADLAFLSACQTATGDESLSEEAVHLAAGMLMAGYRSVIATMWSIGDEDAPLIAEKVYEHLLEGGLPDSRRAAMAVHKATECLRAKVGVDAFMKWVPYIHIGQ